MLVESVLHRIEGVPLPPMLQGESVLDYGVRVVVGARAEAGDVLVSVVEGDLGRIEEAVVGTDAVLHRGTAISDVYRSAFALRLLQAAGADDPHELQLRRYRAEGQSVLQVAAYPTPPAERGVRLWCAPAFTWIFVDGPDPRRFTRGLDLLRPSWERVRVHHGPPLQAAVPRDLAGRYPVEDPVRPLSAQDVEELRGALDTLVGQSCVDALVRGTATPRQAVDTTLSGRAALALHIDRLDKVLEHSHGRAEVKVDLFREAAATCLPDTDDSAREHLIAPHRHLVDGMRETQKQVRAAVDGASTTAALMSSAAVGRLLDRSRANRQASTAVAVGALLIAVLSIFTSLAAIPDRGRAVGDLVRLGSWVGVGGILLLGTAYLLAMLSALPSATAPDWLSRRASRLVAAGAVVALCLFVAAGVSGSLGLLAGGVLAMLCAAVVRAWTDEY